jgi:hypothetical protein
MAYPNGSVTEVHWNHVRAMNDFMVRFPEKRYQKWLAGEAYI